MKAPEIDIPGLDWINTTGPLSLEQLAGRFVILDFWTFCCINCLQVLPTLRRVEEAFPDELVVVGVHSPKFSAERDSSNVKSAVSRYGIEHPVVSDPEMKLWRAYAVRAWPSLVFVGPDGEIFGHHSGEPDPDELLATLGEAIAGSRGQGTLRPGRVELAASAPASSELRFPGKLKALPGREKSWAIADSGNHRIVLIDDGGRVTRRIGSGRPGSGDGRTGDCEFNSPQGLACTEGLIYVADTGNHALRLIDIDGDRVSTIAGLGRRGHPLGPPTEAASTPLASPWDLEVDSDGLLYIANAGTHQIGRMDLEAGTVEAFAGSGMESITDGAGPVAALAQPSGLAIDVEGGLLFFADSETSALRSVELGGRHRVRTLVGSGLFDFGHRNGPLDQALMQHPLGLALAGSHVVMADSYNNALRVADLDAGSLADLDDGFECTDELCLPLAEPAGVASDGDTRLLVSDTNNHRVLEYLLEERRYRTLL